MSKHCKETQPANLVEVIATHPHTVIRRRRRIIWLAVVGTSSVMYVLGLNEVLPFGFAFQHVEELILTTGVVRVIGA